MITKIVPSQPPKEYLLLDQKRKLGIVKRIKKQMVKFDIHREELGLLIT